MPRAVNVQRYGGRSLITRPWSTDGVDVTIYAWARTEDWWPLTTELSRLVRQLFANEGIEIPYPHVQVLSSKWSVTAMVRADR
jgi:hypothetical protein